MKGKEAASAARKRVVEAEAECEQLTRTLKNERAAHQQQVHDLEAQVRSARANHMAEAARLAAEEVKRRLDEAERERRDRGLSDDIVKHMLYRTDRFILNACRYVSMTTGELPLDALAMVLAWKTDKDVNSLPQVDQLIELGIPLDGWVARELRSLGKWRKTAVGKVSAMSLDRADQEGHQRIDPRYRSSWYPQNVEYGGIELVHESAS